MSIHIEDLTVRFKNSVTAIDHADLDIPNGIFGLLGENGAGKTTLMRVLTTVKNNQIPLEHYYSACMPQEKFREIYEAYEKWRKENKKLDFDDLMVQCKRLFLERPEVLRAWQQKFQYILIDEFQDISPVQYEIVRMLALPENNLFIVGDDDQSIYQFRGEG